MASCPPCCSTDSLSCTTPLQLDEGQVAGYLGLLLLHTLYIFLKYLSVLFLVKAISAAAAPIII